MTATMRPEQDLRPCRLYRIYGWDPRTNYTTKTLLYIGETLQEAFDRFLQHVGRQPWADTITSHEVDDRIFPGKDAVVAAEKAAVEAEKPLYNKEWNLGNDQRIDLDTAKLQRWARDDQRGQPRWRPGSSRTMYRHGHEVEAPQGGNPRPYGQVSPDRASPVRQGSTGRLKPRHRWQPWQRRLAGWGSTWLGSTLATWISVLYWHLGQLGWRQAGIFGLCVLPGVLVALQLFLLTRTERTRDRVWKKIWRWWR